jgi:hypothetical protein
MAENDIVKYIDALQEVLDIRKEWLDRQEMGKLKDNLRIFHTSFSSLFNIYLKKKLIDEDPYKHESKISELEVPDSSPFMDAKRIEQLSIRLSDYDNQLDFLVNFYQLGIDFLNLDRIKRIVGLIRYIDWVSFSLDSPVQMTKAVAEMTNQSKLGVDGITLGIIAESVSRMSKMTAAVMAILKDLNVYYRESYKLSIRQNISKEMSANDATLDNIRKKMSSAMPGSPFYKELVEEVIKEDYSPGGADLRDSLLTSLMIKEEKPKAVKQIINYKNILLDGIQVIGGASTSLMEIIGKLEENHTVLENRKKGFLEIVKELIRQITNAEPEEVIYNIECIDQNKGTTVKEKVNYHNFRDEIQKKIKILNSFVRGSAYTKLSAMTEEQIISYLDKNIKDVQNLHRVLNAMDDFFKKTASDEERSKIKGIKPELSALKNSYVKANQIRYDYNAQKEEEEQMKRLGFAGAPPTAPEAAGTPAAATPSTPPVSSTSS